MERGWQRRLITGRRTGGRIRTILILAITAVLSGCASSNRALRMNGYEEYLVLHPFRISAQEVPDSLAALEVEVSSWLEARPNEYQGKSAIVKITSDGRGVIAWTETTLFDEEIECKVWTQVKDGAWIGRSIELGRRPRVEKCSGAFLCTSAAEIFDLREDVPARVNWPEHLRFIGITPNGDWIGADGDQIVCGTIRNGEVHTEFSSEDPPYQLRDRWDSHRVYWLHGYEVGILRRGGIVDFVKQTVKPLKLPRTPFVAIGHPAIDRLICYGGKGLGRDYVVVQISRDGEAEEIRPNWSVQRGDQLWATSPSGVFIGGRRWSLANLLPGGYGPNTIRLIHDLAPRNARAPRLHGVDFVGWLRYSPGSDPTTSEENQQNRSIAHPTRD